MQGPRDGVLHVEVTNRQRIGVAMRNTDRHRRGPYADAGQLLQRGSSIQWLELSGVIDERRVTGGNPQRFGALFFDAQSMELPRRYPQEALGSGWQSKSERPGSHLAVSLTEQRPLSQRLCRSDSLPEHRGEHLVIRGVAGGKVQVAHATNGASNGLVSGSHWREWCEMSTEPFCSLSKPLAARTPRNNVMSPVLEDIDTDAARAFGGEACPLNAGQANAGVLWSGLMCRRRRHHDSGRWVAAAIAQQGEIVGMSHHSEVC